MRRILSVVIALLAAQVTVAAAAAPPYLKLAQALGTPALAESYGTPTKSQLLLKFVARGESLKRWTKMTTVSILKVPDQETAAATRAVVARTQSMLASRRVKLVRFDRALSSAPSAYFEFQAGGEQDKGVIYSPHAGYVTVAQISAKSGASFSAGDVATLKSITAPH